MQGFKFGVCLLVMLCWASVAVGATDAGSEPKQPLTYEQMKKMSAADLLRRTDATAEEDFEAGNIAMDRMEVVEAQGLYERAGKKGHSGAMVKYGDLMNRAGFIDDARSAYRHAAELGDPAGQYNLGAMYMDLGNYDWNDLDSKARPLEARKWILKAAEQGYKDAINVMALSYAEGGLGLTDAERTDAEVLKWINKSADLGNGAAMDWLAEAYRKGKYGLKVDTALAKEWATKAKLAYGIKEKKEKVQRKRRR
jgi:TPR repeat protein